MEEIDKHINGEDLNPKFWKKIMEGYINPSNSIHVVMTSLK